MSGDASVCMYVKGFEKAAEERKEFGIYDVFLYFTTDYN